MNIDNYLVKSEAVKQKEYFLKKAQENFPEIYYHNITPKVDRNIFEKSESFILDLGNHYVGCFSFSMDIFEDFISAPVQLIIRFGEDMREINDDFSAYKGTISGAWLQEESLFVDYPQTVQMNRRYACRYIKITVKESRRKIKLYDFCFRASTSADMSGLKPANIFDQRLKKIDEISVNTLKECMQTFFEDGPKRDRRLWLGDFRLEALTNYYTFNNTEIVKRCLYLFAAGDYDELGFLPSYIYETPYYFSGKDHIADYALLFVVSVCDYYQHTEDLNTVLDLLSICKDQLRSFENILDENGIITRQKGWFAFIDWCEGLRALTSLQGVYLYTLERFIGLLEKIGDNEKSRYEQKLASLRKATRKYLFDEEKGVFVNKTDEYQLSVHSQVWMILGGVINGNEGVAALQASLGSKNAKQSFTPYMRHYVIEAMIKLGMMNEAVSYIKKFWGEMVDLGADTFYEVYVPGEPEFSPYKDRMINSLCHAWSCTPAYFIRKYFK